MSKSKLFGDVSYCRGQIFKLKQGFGFIKHGNSRDENIFFNQRSLVTPANVKIYNLSRYLQIGEVVECIYGESLGDFAGKFSALRVWKLNANNKTPDRIVSLNSRILCGTAKIIFRIRDVGILDVREEDDDDNNQQSTEFVYFNLKDMCYPAEEVDHLVCNRHIHFMAFRATEGSDTDYSWNAIRIWKTNNRIKEIEHNQTNLFYAKVEVISVNTIGAVLVHNGHKIALVWTELQLSESTMEFYETEKGDLMWCLVAKSIPDKSTEQEQWIVRKILDTFTHESEEDHPLPKFYKNNYSVLPTPSNDEILQQEFLKEFQADDTGTSNGSIFKGGRKKLTNQQAAQPQTEKLARYNYDCLDLVPSLTNGELKPMKTSCDCACHYLAVCSTGEIQFEMSNCEGTMNSITPYGGKIDYEEDPSAKIVFGAHNFYCDGVPMAHTGFQVGTKVHFNAKRMEGHFQAVQVWIGSTP